MAVLLVALVAISDGRASIARLKRYVFDTTSERGLASFVNPGTGRDKSGETKGWLEVVRKKVDVISAAIEMQPTGMVGRESQTYVRIGQD